MQKLNLNNYIVRTLSLTVTARRRRATTSFPASHRQVAWSWPVRKIIGQGDMVDEYNFRVLNSMEKEMERRQVGKSQITRHLVGNAIYVFSFVFLFTLYLSLFRRDYYSKPRCVAMLYTLIAAFPVCVSLMMEHSYFNFSVYVRLLSWARSLCESSWIRARPSSRISSRCSSRPARCAISSISSLSRRGRPCGYLFVA